MKKEWKIVAITGVFAAACAGYFWGIPAAINLPKNKSLIENAIRKNTGFNLKLGKARLSMGSFPSVWIKSNNISVINKNSSKALSINNPKVKVKLFPLLFKKIEISHITADDELANFVYRKDKKICLGDYPIEIKKNGKFTLEKAYLDIGKYKINFDDKLNAQKISLQGEYLKHVKYRADDKLQFATKGNFILNQKAVPYDFDVDMNLPLNRFNDDQLKLNGYIKNFDLSSISPYAPVLTKGGVQNLKGFVSFNADTTVSKNNHRLIDILLKTKDLEINGNNKVEKIWYKDELTLDAKLTTIANGVHFQKAVLKSKDFDAQGAGDLTASGQRIPAMDLTLDVKPTRLEKICQILPWLRTFPREMDLYKFKEYRLFGNGKVKLHFIGQGKRPEVFGKININSAYVTKPYPTAPQGAKIDMDFHGKVMKLDVFFPTDKNQHVTVLGNIKIDGSRYSELDINTTDSIEMSGAETVLNPLHEIFKFKLGPVPVMKIKGSGQIHLKTKGKKISPHLHGKMTFKNATASFNQVHNLVLKNASGVIDFNDQEVPFKVWGGTINGKTADIHGKCNVFGDMNVFAQTKGQHIPDMIKVINTSPEMKDVQKVVKPFTKPDGTGDLYLNIYGNAKDAANVKFNEDMFARGKVTFHNATTLLQDTHTPFKSVNGYVNFDKKDADYDVSGFIKNNKIRVKGITKDKFIDLTATSDRAQLIDLFNMFKPDMKIPFKNDVGKLNVSFVGKYKGIVKDNNIDYDKITAHGKILPNMNTNYPIRLRSGEFDINRSTLNARNLKGLFHNIPFALSFTGTDIYTTMKLKSGSFYFDNFNIASLNNISKSLDIPKKYMAQLNNITDLKGSVDIKGSIRNGGIYFDSDLRNLRFVYKPLHAGFHVISGHAKMNGNTLYLSRINSKLSSMPIYANGRISNVLNNPNLNMYVAGKFNQEFFDKLVNEKTVYPVKLKGDANYTARLNGTADNLRARSELNIEENSSIYYMGATLSGAPSGSTNLNEMATNPVTIKADTNIYPNKIRINSLDYIQTIASQNRRTSEQKQLSMSGTVSLLKKNVLKFQNLRVKTFEPTDAKIFNILLKKPVIKQGIFMTNTVINGTSLKPYVLGNLNITGIDIPLLDSTIRDIDIDLKKDFITVKSKGIILTNDISLVAKIVNSPNPPYVIEDLKIKSDGLDLNVIANRFNDMDTDKLRNNSSDSEKLMVTPDMIVLKNGEILADKVLIKKAQATDFNAKMTMANNKLKIDNYNFNLAKGEISGKIYADLTTQEMNADMNINGADAEIISENFFDMPGQVYGIVTGSLKSHCKGSNSVECVNTLGGEGSFSVKDGKMPKLGSLEYLLKAANLVTGGITRVSINGIIDLITPLKTGNFDMIKGDIKVENGVATDVNVYSSGKELNLYLTGSYNIATLVADMSVYGSLSKNFSTILGKIGNASLGRMLNTIPRVKINEITPATSSDIKKIPNFNPDNVLRVFKADIYGDINGSNYVKSFRWIKH